jgi:hypothetical protein
MARVEPTILAPGGGCMTIPSKMRAAEQNLTEARLNNE